MGRSFAALSFFVLVAVAFPGPHVSPACSQTPTGGQATPPKIEGFAVIPVDLNTGAFSKGLPFDIPFFISGQALPGTVRLRIQYKSDRKKIEMQQVDSVCPAKLPKDSPWRQPDTAVWSPAQPATDSMQFQVLMDPLDVNRYYVFRLCFDVEVAGDPLKKLQASARTAVDSALRPLQSLAIPRETTLALQRGLSREVGRLLSQRVVPEQGTLFDPELREDSPLVKQLELLLLNVVSPPVNVANEGIPYANHSTRLSNELREARGASFVAFVNTLRRDGDETVQATLNAYKNSVAIAKDDNSALNELALGRSPTLPSASIDALWTPDAASTYAANYQGLVDALKGLQSFITTLVGNDDAVKSLESHLKTKPSPDDVAGLRKLPDGPIQNAVRDATTLQTLFEALRSSLSEREQALNQIAGFVAVHARETRFGFATTSQVASTNYNPYVSAEGGFLYAPVISYAAAYLASNIYFRPINKDVPLNQRGGFRRRFAVTFGLTVNSIADSAGTRADLFGSSALLVGGGFRVTQSVRLAGGVLVFKEKNPNPLINTLRVTTTGYFSVSFDVDVAKGIGKLFGS